MDEAIRNTIYVLNDVPSCFNYKLLWNSICANRYTDAEGVKGNLVTKLSQLGCGINEAVRHICCVASRLCFSISQDHTF